MIIQDDAYNVMSWMSSNGPTPWQLAIWIEEIGEVCHLCHIPFVRILKETNSQQDSLANGDVSRNEIGL